MWPKSTPVVQPESTTKKILLLLNIIWLEVLGTNVVFLNLILHKIVYREKKNVALLPIGGLSHKKKKSNEQI